MTKISKKVLIESVAQYENELLGYRIRVWREESEFNEEAEIQNDIEYQAVFELLEGTAPTRAEVAHALLSIDRVNAVEVKDELGSGVVFYADWP